MSVILRSAPLRAARAAQASGLARQQMRFAHVENVVDHALPTDVKNKPWLAVKVAAFSVVGFGTPFFMAWYQISKASAA